MTDKSILVNIGAEYDLQLRKRLIATINAMGGVMEQKKWGMAGSQSLEELSFLIDGSELRIESETYIGLTIMGDKEIVDKIVTLLNVSSS